MTYCILQSDAAHLPLADASVQCVVTSPPYWGLRDYGNTHAGSIGLEPTLDEYMARMVAVFREVRRVLRDDGTLWLNMGDAYWGGKGENGSSKARATAEHRGYVQSGGTVQMSKRPSDGKHKVIKPKELIGQPWRLAFALQADGWYLRSDITWHKPNPMPESVTDRPTKSHEYVFLLTKRARYYYDNEAVKETSTDRFERKCPESGTWLMENGRVVDPDAKVYGCPESGRNLRTVWTIPTHAFPEAHFATFPPRLVEPCIRAGTSERGCCPECGAPWKRVVSKTDKVAASHNGSRFDVGKTAARDNGDRTQAGERFESVTTGWHPTCKHGREPVPCLVFDPFCGAGTTGLVARRLGRRFIGTELNAGYIAMARKRIHEDAPLFE